MNMKQQNSLIESFHEMWDAFPGMARLINSKHEILASNQNAQDKGYIPGAICASVPSANGHRGCLLAKTLQTGEGQFDRPNEHLIRGWLPVAGHSDIVVHFSLVI
jgi:hypothetical protein